MQIHYTTYFRTKHVAGTKCRNFHLKCKRSGFSSAALCVKMETDIGCRCFRTNEPEAARCKKGGDGVYIAVCDDRAETLDAMASLLFDWEAERQFSLHRKLFSSALELLEAARRERFTLYLLDVMMPGMNGLEAAREIRRFDDAAEIVFLSTSPGFAYESYGVRALNYLLKPVEREKLFGLLDQLCLREEKTAEALTLKTSTTIVRVPYSHISYVEVIGKHVYFHLTDGNVREVAGALKDFEAELLRRPEFMRVHRSYIVNMFQVEELSSAGLRTFQGESLPVSRLSYAQIQKDYLALLFEQREVAGS